MPAAVAPPPPDPFQEEAKQLRYVGYVEDGPRMMAFIIRGPEVYTVEAGATISERFRVQTITEDAVLVSSPTGEKQARLPLAASVAAIPKQ
jgi:Tfp pilus assembly protein PilP